jgi:hypothetical protein
MTEFGELPGGDQSYETVWPGLSFEIGIAKNNITDQLDS